ncbi:MULTISPECIES: hypothetical protein [Carnobacterium]|uniref:hypothetical protein n=1 Tax=Carnobacterium TaxID=2747 RepID=UPI0030F592FE
MIELAWPLYYLKDESIKKVFNKKENLNALRMYEDEVNKELVTFNREIVAFPGNIYIYPDYIDVTLIIVNNTDNPIANIGIDTVISIGNEFVEGGFIFMKDKYGEIKEHTGIVEFLKIPNQFKQKFNESILTRNDYQIEANISYGIYQSEEKLD